MAKIFDKVKEFILPSTEENELELKKEYLKKAVSRHDKRTLISETNDNAK